MNEKERKILANKIIYHIPPQHNAATYLMDHLNISRESAYRRLRGEIAFTLDDIIVLSGRLGFSIDQLIDSTLSNHVLVTLSGDTTTSQEDTFVNMLRILYDAIQAKGKMLSDVQVLISLNKLYPFFYASRQHLLKFYYFEWRHQILDTPSSFHYGDTIVPSRVNEMCRLISYETLKQSAMRVIVAPNLFVNSLQKVQYYHERRLISDNELRNIKEDLAQILDEIEADTARGVTHSGGAFEVYVSSFNVAQNSVSILDGKYTKSLFWVDPVNMVSVTNSNFCLVHKRWFDSLKKYSSPISGCNLAMRNDFFEGQRAAIQCSSMHALP
ncbi:MAG: hypothetical protein LBL78_05040 [Prevotellaceae bacterium]|jgi:hypothetical protein|nr:hypothetical protein [Prevotellaceae bacterium]